MTLQEDFRMSGLYSVAVQACRRSEGEQEQERTLIRAQQHLRSCARDERYDFWEEKLDGLSNELEKDPGHIISEQNSLQLQLF